MSWQNAVVFVALVAAIVVGPALGADPKLVGLATTIAAGWLVQRKTKCDCHKDSVDDSAEEEP